MFSLLLSPFHPPIYFFLSFYQFYISLQIKKLRPCYNPIKGSRPLNFFFYFCPTSRSIDSRLETVILQQLLIYSSLARKHATLFWGTKPSYPGRVVSGYMTAGNHKITICKLALTLNLFFLFIFSFIIMYQVTTIYMYS